MRLLSIQELPQSGRVKLVFDDETVLKTQPYLLADFGLYSGMELSEEDYQALDVYKRQACRHAGSACFQIRNEPPHAQARCACERELRKEMCIRDRSRPPRLRSRRA